MKQQNFFEDPKGVLQEIQQQSLRLQQRQEQQDTEQQHPEQQPPHYQTQPRRRLSTFTSPPTVQQVSSTPITTIPTNLAYPSTISLGNEQPTTNQPMSTAVNRRPKPGILRLDMSKPRRSSGGSVEFRMQPQMYGANILTPVGTTPPPHQLSVTWATPPCDLPEREFKIKPAVTQAGALDAAAIAESGGGSGNFELHEIAAGRKRSPEEKPYEFSLSYAASNLASPVTEPFIDFPLHRHYEDYSSQSPGYSIHTTNTDNNNDDDNDDDDDDEDYSVSVSAIMQRRASVRGYRRKSSSRNSRRASSPMDHVLDNAERRRSSVYTTSSDEGTNQESTQEQIFENIRLHKEVIQSVKLQPWPIRKKLKLVRQAKTYVARHEGALQERFAMSRSTRDLWARFKIVMAARWRHWKRETYSFLTVLIPWELRIKEIESHFGSGVASYFTFLRWLMWVNVMIALPLVIFVIGPEYFATKHNETDPRKKMSTRESLVAGNLLTIWEFEGYLKYSPMFYGYYSSYSGASSLGYMLPLAYFLTAVVVYIYSFVATLRKMAENSRNSKLSSKDDECTFSWKLFTGWDFMIGHAETAHNRIASVVVGFKEALLEEAEKKKDNRNWRIILQRILVNILVIALLAASGVTVVTLVNMSEELNKKDNWLSKNAVNVTMNLLALVMPMIFEALGLFENWHPRQQLRLQLARVMILNLLNLYSLMFTFIYKINDKEKPLIALQQLNDSATQELRELDAFWENFKAMTTTAANEISYATDSSVATALLANDTTAAVATTTEAIMTTAAAVVVKLRCYNQTVRCSKPWRVTKNLPSTTTVATTTLMLLNLTTTMMPTMTSEQSTETTWTTTTNAKAEVTTDATTTEQLTTSTTQLPFNTTMFDILTTTSSGSSSYRPETTFPFTTTSSTTEEDVTSTTHVTSTTTDLPYNNTQFDYYEYFEGLPLDAEEDESPNEDGSPKQRRDLKKGSHDFKDFSDSPNEVFKTTLEPKKPKAKGKRLKVKLAKSNRPVVALRKKPKYSRRELPQDSTATPMIYDETTTTALPDSTTTTTGTTTTNADFTTNYPTPSADTSTQSATDPTTTPSKALVWETNEHLQELLDFFTTSTMRPRNVDTTTPTTRQAPLTTMRILQDDDEYDEGATTPFYLEGDQEIGPTVSYNLNEFNNGSFGWCVRTVCVEDTLADTETTTATNSLTTALTVEQEYRKNRTKIQKLFNEVELNLTTMCWETSLGQELAKVIVLDGIMSIGTSLGIDFLRALFVRYVNQKWCWDMEKTFPQYGDFKIAENILMLINNQGQVWMGIFFSPGLVLINLVKLVIMMYFRSWIVLTCNVPHEVVFKASKSNNFYLALLLTVLFLCVLPVGYAVVWLRPSWHCGPFSNYKRISEFITNTTREALPDQLHGPLNYLTSSSTVIPLLLLLILIIYYLVSLTGALREANQDLKTQLQKEREEERKKFFQVPEIKQAENSSATLTNRWRKVLEASSPVTPTAQPDFESEAYKTQARKELISRIMKKALRKDSATSDEETLVRHGRDDDTDTEHHDSLPHDEDGNEKRPGLSRLQQIRRTRKPSLVDIVQIANSERERLRSLKQHKQQDGNGGKETHPRGKFRVDKAERKHEKEEQDKEKLKEKEKEKDKEKEKEKEKEKDKDKESADNGNDPEIKTRVINERRQSLLRKKKEDEEKVKDKDKDKDNDKDKSKEKDHDIEKNKDVEPNKQKESEKEKLKEVTNIEHKEREKEKKPLEHKENNNKDKNKDKTKDAVIEKEHDAKEKPSSPPMKKRIYDSLRRKKRDDKEKIATVKQNSLEKTSEEDSKAEDTSPNDNNKKEHENGNKKSRSLRKKNKQNAAADDSKPEKSPPKTTGKSSYKVVDEKSTSPNEDKPSTLTLEHLQNLGGKLKFKRHKAKPSTEPEVFKFETDNITNKEADIATTPTWQHLEAEQQSPRTAEEVTTPTSHNHLNLGADKLANFSRQSRRKIGSFLTLVKDAVKRPEHEQDAEGHHNPDTAIDMPSTPRLQMSSAFGTAFMIPVAMHTTTTPHTSATTDSIQPYIMPRAPLEVPEDIEPPSYSHTMANTEIMPIPYTDAEELDKPGPIVFPQRVISQRRRIADKPIRQDSQSSNWSVENIPTITISTTSEGDDLSPKSPSVQEQVKTTPTSANTGAKVNVIKINIEHDK